MPKTNDTYCFESMLRQMLTETYADYSEPELHVYAMLASEFLQRITKELVARDDQGS